MESWLQQIFSWLPSGGVYFLLVGVISFLESLAFVGILVPGSVLIVFAGFFAAHGKGDYTLLIVASATGAMLGDLLSYWLGARFGAALLARPFARRRQDLVRRAELFFVSHGGKSVLLGRFVGFFRPFIPFVAGCASMRPLPFLLYVLVGGVLWGIAYPGLGYFFGASWHLVQVWTGRLSLLIALLVLLFILNALLWKYLLPAFFRGCAWVWSRIARLWRRLLSTGPLTSLATRYPSLWGFLADRFTLRRGSGLYLTVGLAVCLLFATLLVWEITAIHLHEPIFRLDQRIYQLARGIGHPASDAFFLVVTCLGSTPVLLMLAGLALLWLILSDRDFSAFILGAGLAGGELLVFALKALIGRPRPEPFFPELHLVSASFPSAHAFSGALFYGLVIYLLLEDVRNWQARITLVLSGSFLVLLIGASRLYLGVHWLSDILGGLVLAGLWLTVLITASEMRRRYGGEFPWRRGPGPLNPPRWIKLPLLGLAALGVGWGVTAYCRGQLEKDLPRSAPVAASRLLSLASGPETLISRLPSASEDLLGNPVRPLGLILFARQEPLEERLAVLGWEKPHTLSLFSFLRSTQALLRGAPDPRAPVLPRLVDGRGFDLAFVRPLERAKGAREVLLLWRLGYHLSGGQEAWGGIVSLHQGYRSLGGIPLPWPLLDPEVDPPRDRLAGALGEQTANPAPRGVLLSREGPVEGFDGLGNPFHSDGRVWLIVLSK